LSPPARSSACGSDRARGRNDHAARDAGPGGELPGRARRHVLDGHERQLDSDPLRSAGPDRERPGPDADGAARPLRLFPGLLRMHTSYAFIIIALIVVIA